MLSTGSADTGLVVLRGNSGAGKTTLAQALQRRRRGGLAVVSHDVIRRTILRVPCRPGNPAIGLIDRVARYSLDEGFDVVVEGILTTEVYGRMLERLAQDHAGRTRFYRYELPVEESLRRLAARPASLGFGPVDTEDGWRADDRLPFVEEIVLDESVSEAAAVRRVVRDMDW